MFVKPNSQKQKVEWWLQEAGGGENRELLFIDIKLQLCKMNKFQRSI